MERHLSGYASVALRSNMNKIHFRYFISFKLDTWKYNLLTQRSARGINLFVLDFQLDCRRLDFNHRTVGRVRLEEDRKLEPQSLGFVCVLPRLLFHVRLFYMLLWAMNSLFQYLRILTRTLLAPNEPVSYLRCALSLTCSCSCSSSFRHSCALAFRVFSSQSLHAQEAS